MAKRGPIKGLAGWFFHRLAASYWSLPLVATLIALPAAWIALSLDRHGWGEQIAARDLQLTPVAGAAQEFASVIVGVNAALLTLYFSITLLVLTIATANLGVRLIDRWLDKGLTRVSLSGLTFNLIFSLVVLASIDPDAAPESLPHFTLWSLIALETVNVAMLAVALHDLGRTIFVDRSIAHIARDIAQSGPDIVAVEPREGNWAATVRAPVGGYVEGIDLSRIARTLAVHPGTVRFCCAPGSHVLKGEPVALLEKEGAGTDEILKSIPIGKFRSDGQGAVFEIRLLVEIAARALSPAVNDFYTALTCADRIGDAMAGQRDLWIDEGKMAAWKRDTRFELPGQDFRGLYARPLKAFRQAAADYPSVAIRLIDVFARVASLSDKAGMAAFLRAEAAAMADHAAGRATYRDDADDIRAALAAFDARLRATPTG